MLTIRQPWAWAIIYGGKDVENRSWLTKHRGPLLVHAGSAFEPDGYGVAVTRYRYRGARIPTPWTVPAATANG